MVPSIETTCRNGWQATRALKIDLQDDTVDVEVNVDEGPLISSQEIAVKIYDGDRTPKIGCLTE